MGESRNLADSSAHVVVVGSVNMDLVARVARLPRPGETVAGRELLQIPGGKGANQAVAAARLGAHTTLIGRVGDDAFAQPLIESLRHNGVVVEHVQCVHSCSSGLAVIGVEDSGQNCITIIAGANGRLSPADVGQYESVIASARVVLLQLEIPLESVTTAAQLARRHGVLTILDPAPAAPLPRELFAVDLISPNQTEAEQLTGIPVNDIASAQRAARELLVRGSTSAVIKLGEQGAFWLDRQQRSGYVPATPVTVLDTTAAGDAFTAALGLALAEGQELPQAVRFGCAAGTLATTRMGAQQSMPDRQAVERFLGE